MTGKRVIFTGPCTLPAREGAALDAGILPGSEVVQSATGFNQSADAATVFKATTLIADYDMLKAGDTETALTQNDAMIARAVPKDETVNILVATGQTLALGTPLARNGDGTFRVAATDGTEQILFEADEVVVTSGVTLVAARGV